MPQSEGKTQTTSLSLYLGPRPNNEPGTLFASLLDVRMWQVDVLNQFVCRRVRLPRGEVAAEQPPFSGVNKALIAASTSWAL